MAKTTKTLSFAENWNIKWVIMGNYIKYANPQQIQAVQAVQPAQLAQPIQPIQPVQPISIDVKALAKEISKFISKDGNSDTSDFDNKGSLENLADGMTVQRGNKKSNFDDLGEVKTIVKNNVQSTLDLLEGLD